MNNTSSFLSSLRSDPYLVAVATLIMIFGFWGITKLGGIVHRELRAATSFLQMN
ncbi:hypothetical protein [Undibacterium sp. Di24W]|uniref:hypothetical protein n=1 Tax=Undibacterium sp. Di24W TaxID=3413033 RepID=UPI003BF1B224